jgi:hypothetical protein
MWLQSSALDVYVKMVEHKIVILGDNLVDENRGFTKKLLYCKSNTPVT